MAKNRIVNTRFWRDDYISNLDPTEKLLFLYFITCPDTDISGIYEIPLKTVATDTGIDRDMVEKILKRFAKDKKIFYEKGWVGIVNFAKHQLDNPKVQAGIKNGLAKAPDDIKHRLSLSIDRLSHTNTDTDTNLNTDTDPDRGKSKKNKDALFEQLVILKGWGNKPRKEINAVYPRFTKVLDQILELSEFNLEHAINRLTRVAVWADNNDLDWSPETVIKKWLDIDELPQEKKKKATIEGDKAYQRGDDWWVILPNGEHKRYIGSISNVRYE